MPVTEIIRSLRECIQRISDKSVACEMAEKLDQLQHVTLATHEKLHEQQRELEQLAAQVIRPNTLSAVWPGLCYDPAV